MISEEQIMTTLGLFIWCLGAAILCDRIFSFFRELRSQWSGKRKWFELAMLLVGSALILVGTALQIMAVQ
jgi:cytochrome c biogenesis protein CcdA